MNYSKNMECIYGRFIVFGKQICSSRYLQNDKLKIMQKLIQSIEGWLESGVVSDVTMIYSWTIIFKFFVCAYDIFYNEKSSKKLKKEKRLNGISLKRGTDATFMMLACR
jgi:preprotein translocase subunit SecY